MQCIPLPPQRIGQTLGQCDAVARVGLVRRPSPGGEPVQSQARGARRLAARVPAEHGSFGDAEGSGQLGRAVRAQLADKFGPARDVAGDQVQHAGSLRIAARSSETPERAIKTATQRPTSVRQMRANPVLSKPAPGNPSPATPAPHQAARAPPRGAQGNGGCT